MSKLVNQELFKLLELDTVINVIFLFLIAVTRVHYYKQILFFRLLYWFCVCTYHQSDLPWTPSLHHSTSQASTMCSSTSTEKTSKENLFLILILSYLLLDSPHSFTMKMQSTQHTSKNLFSISVVLQLLFSPKPIRNLLGVFSSFNKSLNGKKLIVDMFCQYITKSSHLMYGFRRVILEKPSKQLHTKHSQEKNWRMACPDGATHSPKLQIPLDGMGTITGKSLTL